MSYSVLLRTCVGLRVCMHAIRGPLDPHAWCVTATSIDDSLGAEYELRFSCFLVRARIWTPYGGVPPSQPLLAGLT
jgi:hypothetical protein